MITSIVIEGLLDYLKDEILKDFPIVNQYVFDEKDDWGQRGIQYITKQGVFEKIEGNVPKDWVLLVWNRESITPGEVHQRRMTFTSFMEGGGIGVSNMKMGKIPIRVNIVCSNVEIAEWIEEYLFVLAGESVAFDINVPDFGKFTVGITPAQDAVFEKLTLENYGSLTKVEKTFEINYPVVLPQTLSKEIRTINDRLGIVFQDGIKKVRHQILD